MPLFGSERERRLWALTLVIVMTIYSTLGLARTLAGVLRDRGMFDNLFILGFFLLGAAVVTQALKTRPSIAQVGVGLGIAAVYIMVFARTGIPEERTHLFEYSLVAVVLYEALTERRSNGRPVWAPAALADVGFNALAGFIAIIATLALAWARNQVQSRRS